MTRASKPLCPYTLRRVATTLTRAARQIERYRLSPDPGPTVEELDHQAARLRCRADRIERQRKASKP